MKLSQIFCIHHYKAIEGLEKHYTMHFYPAPSLFAQLFKCTKCGKIKYKEMSPLTTSLKKEGKM